MIVFILYTSITLLTFFKTNYLATPNFMSPVSTPYETTFMAAKRSIEARYNDLLQKSSKSGKWQYFGTYFDYVAAGYFESFQRCLIRISDGKVYVMSVDAPHEHLVAIFNYAISRSFEAGLGEDNFYDHFLPSSAPIDYWRIWNCGEHVKKVPDYALIQTFSRTNQATGQNEEASRVLIALEVGVGHERSVCEVIREAAQYLSRYTNVAYAIGVFFHGNHHTNNFEFEYFVLQRTEENVFVPNEDYNENRCLGNSKPKDFRYQQGREDFFEEHGVRFLVPPTTVTSTEIQQGNAEIRFWLPGTGLSPLGEDIDPIEIVVRNNFLQTFRRQYINWWNITHH